MKRSVLRRLVRAKFDTFKDFADAMGVTTTTVSGWSRADYNIPLDQLEKICEVLDIKREEIGDIFYPMIEGRLNEE